MQEFGCAINYFKDEFESNYDLLSLRKAHWNIFKIMVISQC